MSVHRLERSVASEEVDAAFPTLVSVFLLDTGTLSVLPRNSDLKDQIHLPRDEEGQEIGEPYPCASALAVARPVVAALARWPIAPGFNPGNRASVGAEERSAAIRLAQSLLGDDRIAEAREG
jgi:hypothetical protein